MAGAAGATAGSELLGGRLLAGAFPALASVNVAPPSDPGRIVGVAETGVLKLDANENPLGPSPAARQAIQEAIADGNRYPIAEPEELIDALAGLHKCDRQRILLGCGSTELLRACMAALLMGGGRLVTADPAYEDPFDYSRPFGTRVTRVPVDADGAHDLAAMEREAREASVVYVCNPSNPTGTIVDGKTLADFVRRVGRRATVIVDEAYHDYVADPRHASMIPLIDEDVRLIVTRTFSKIHGLAGLRLGYALASPKTLEPVSAHMTFAGASVLAVRAALASLQDHAFYEQCRRENAAVRERLSAALVARGFPVFASSANFLMFRLGTDVRAFITAMAARGVRVGRPFPPLTEHCRVTLGTAAQIDRFLSEFDSWRQAAAA
jgi:histidinol-phosphate aminotransferase